MYKQIKMKKVFKNLLVFKKNFSLSATKKMNDCNNVTPEVITQTKIKSEGEIQKMISIKMKEYEELISTQTPERIAICSEVNMLETKLRKSFGFSENEDLTIFPKFKFNDPEIDNQLD